jgi:DNA-damage-inducible protein J
MSFIQIRIDEDTKKAAQNILNNLGLDLTSAIKIYLKQIVITKGIPLSSITENGLTKEQEAQIIQASHESKQNLNTTKPLNTEEAIKYLQKL